MRNSTTCSRRSTGWCVKATPPRPSSKRSKRTTASSKNVPIVRADAARTGSKGEASLRVSPAHRRRVISTAWEWQPRGRHARTTGGFMNKGKRYRAAAELAGKAGNMTNLAEAVKLVKQTARAKFDETIVL